jgi:hypothetical protein
MTTLAIELDPREVHAGDMVTGTARLRSKHDRQAQISGAVLSIDLDGEPRGTVTTDFRGEARISVDAGEAGRHRIHATYDGSETSDGNT